MESDMDKIIEQLTAATAGAMTRWCANGMSTTGELVTRLRKADSCAHEFFANAFRPIIEQILNRPGDLEEIEGLLRKLDVLRPTSQRHSFKHYGDKTGGIISGAGVTVGGYNGTATPQAAIRNLIPEAEAKKKTEEKLADETTFRLGTRTWRLIEITDTE